MADSVQVEIETPTGTAYGVLESFPLDGLNFVDCLVIQPESGAQPTRVKLDSPEADKLRKRYPDLAKIKAAKAAKAPAGDAAA